MSPQAATLSDNRTPPLSLYHLLDPEVLADPYPLYRRLRTEDPVHWDPFLHAWVVTRYADVVRVLHDFSADRTPTPEQLTAMGLSRLESDRSGDGETDAVHGCAGPHSIAGIGLCLRLRHRRVEVLRVAYPGNCGSPARCSGEHKATWT